MASRFQVPPFVTRWSAAAGATAVRIEDRLRAAALARPRASIALLALAVPVAWVFLGLFAWFTYDVTHTLPGRRQVREMGNMAQATVLYDVADRPIFTIFKEQRIEVPLEKMSPNL